MKCVHLFYVLLYAQLLSGQIYSALNGEINFVSDAPLEVIEANSNQLQGVLDIGNKNFAFKVYLKSFEGFNSPLQMIHFYENYMEVEDHPIATFKGKILEPIRNSSSIYRAKGILQIHGIPNERIISVQLDVNEKEVSFNSNFLVHLVDHDIGLPRLVYQKIAKEIKVTVSGKLELRK